MALHGAIAIGTFIEAYINTPWEPIPEPGSENKDEKKDEDDVPANDEGKSERQKVELTPSPSDFFDNFSHIFY